MQSIILEAFQNGAYLGMIARERLWRSNVCANLRTRVGMMCATLEDRPRVQRGNVLRTAAVAAFKEPEALDRENYHFR